MSTTESARAVPNAKHTHDFTATVGAGAITTTNFASSVYGGAPGSIEPDDAGTAGTATTVSRSDHEHAIVAAAPGSITPDDAAAEGNATSFARSNHVHGFTCATAAALTRTNTPGEGVASSSARSDHVHSLGVLPWGVVHRSTYTSANGPHSADATTDMAANNVSVIAGHLYEIKVNGLAALSALTGAWQINCHLNGSYLGTFTRITNEIAGATRDPINGSVFWEAPSTQATDDFTVEADLRTGTATITLVGGSDATDPPRELVIVDLGDAP